MGDPDRIAAIEQGMRRVEATKGFCADIGGSFIKFAVVQESGEPGAPLFRETPAEDWDGFCRVLRDLCGTTPGAVPLSISIAGIVDPESGTAFSANVPCINGRPLARVLGEDLGRPVQVTNDADCMVLAEALRGAGVGHRIVFGVVLGSGVGGGLVIDGHIIRGAGGIAGEWGHGPLLGPLTVRSVLIPPQPCGCGQIGCLDTLGGARGLQRLHRLVHGRNSDSREICRAWQSGDAAARATVESWLGLVSGPLAVLVNTLGAGIVPVAGGLGNDTNLIAALDTAVRQRILRRTEAPLVVPSRFADGAGLLGAALLLQQAD